MGVPILKIIIIAALVAAAAALFGVFPGLDALAVIPGWVRVALGVILLVPAGVMTFDLTRYMPLLRLAIIIVAALAVALGFSWLIEQPGSVTVTWFGEQWSQPAWVVAVLALFLTAVAIFAYSVFRMFYQSPKKLRAMQARRRREAGYQALSRGMVAVAAGDSEQARKFARTAERKLDQPALTRLLNAQAAQLEGDDERAEHYFEAMLEDKDTEFLGLRGLIVQSLRKGDKGRALGMAERALSLRPKAQWVNTTLFDLQTDLGQWADARKTIASAHAANVFGKDVARRREAVILLTEAQQALGEDNRDRALQLVMQAAAASPGLAPAAALAARLLAEVGDKRKASRILSDAWAQSPHPDLAIAYAALESDEGYEARRRRFRKMLDRNPDHIETTLTEAEIAIEAERWDTAEGLLHELANEDPNARVCILMATIEKGRGGDEDVVRAWLARALTASRGPQWTCGNCGFATATWGAACPSCNAFDSFEWIAPKTDDTSVPLPQSVLPLLTASKPSAGTGNAGARGPMPVVVENEPADPAASGAAGSVNGRDSTAH